LEFDEREQNVSSSKIVCDDGSSIFHLGRLVALNLRVLTKP